MWWGGSRRETNPQPTTIVLALQGIQYAQGGRMYVAVDQLAGNSFGTYRVGRLLGQGNLSVVYTAQHMNGGRAVMLTLLTLPESCVGRPRERFIARFAECAAEIRLLDHPHIISLLDFGEQAGIPYLVTPLSDGGSLSSLIKREGRCAPELVLELLKQIAEALDYTHANGVVHGSLKPSSIMIDHAYNVQIAGFGLAHMLAMNGVGHIQHSHPHLFSVAGTLLASPTYLAPEIVEGTPATILSDIYSLGIILFEMLCGQPPFIGSDPIDVAMQHVEQRIPGLQEIAPDIPPALDLVLQRALERNPANRINSASKLVTPFSRVLSVLQAVSDPIRPAPEVRQMDQAWMPMPGTTSARLPAMGANGMLETAKWARPVPQFTAQTAAVRPAERIGTSPLPQISRRNTGQLSPEESGNHFTQQAQPGTLSGNLTPSKKQSRRSMLLATGSIVVAGAVGVGLFNLWNTLRNDPATSTQNTPTNTAQNTATPEEQASTPTPPEKLTTDMGVNTAKEFKDPTTGKDSILIHLAEGVFVAYESSCTHEGTTVEYNTETKTLICPNHGSIFDPANEGAVLQGPAVMALPETVVKVNEDGTITTEE